MHHTVICFLIHLKLFLTWRCFHVFSYFSYGFLEIVSSVSSDYSCCVPFGLKFSGTQSKCALETFTNSCWISSIVSGVRESVHLARFWRNSLFRRFFSTVKCIRDPTGFHSDKLHDALQEGDTKTVARIILGKNKVSAKEMLLEIILCFLLMLLLLKRDAWFWLITLYLLVPKT